MSESDSTNVTTRPTPNKDISVWWKKHRDLLDSFRESSSWEKGERMACWLNEPSATDTNDASLIVRNMLSSMYPVPPQEQRLSDYLRRFTSTVNYILKSVDDGSINSDEAEALLRVLTSGFISRFADQNLRFFSTPSRKEWFSMEVNSENERNEWRFNLR